MFLHKKLNDWSFKKPHVFAVPIINELRIPGETVYWQYMNAIVHLAKVETYHGKICFLQNTQGMPKFPLKMSWIMKCP